MLIHTVDGAGRRIECPATMRLLDCSKCRRAMAQESEFEKISKRRHYAKTIMKWTGFDTATGRPICHECCRGMK